MSGFTLGMDFNGYIIILFSYFQDLGRGYFIILKLESIPISSSVCMLTVTLKEQMSVPIYLKLNINYDIP